MAAWLGRKMEQPLGVQFVRVKANSFEPGFVPPAAEEKTGLRFGCGAMEPVGQSRRDEPKLAQGGADANGSSEAQPSFEIFSCWVLPALSPQPGSRPAN